MTGAGVRICAAVLGACTLLGLAAAPAAADPPRPTNYRSTVTNVTPALPVGAEVRVIGGDSLIELSLPPGHHGDVAGLLARLDDEAVPYLRFDADGRVRRNVHAVATTANEARYGSNRHRAGPRCPPAVGTVAANGGYAWHDHRIHWMSPTTQRVVDDDGHVDLGGPDGTWTVPLVVDGRPTVIEGELIVEPAPATAAWMLLAVAAAAVTVGMGFRWGLRAGAAVGAGTAAAATLAAAATWRAVPTGTGASVIPVVVAGVALVGRARSVWSERTGLASGPSPLVLPPSSVGITRGTVLTHAVLPTTLAPTIDRVVTAAAIGAWDSASPPPRGRCGHMHEPLSSYNHQESA